MSLPVDPIMLLSVVNLKLRDQYKDLDALCEDLEADKAGLCAKLHAVGYDYDPQRNQLSDYSFQIRHRCATTVPGPVNDKIRSA